MIKTRLVGLLSTRKKYIVYTILWQWAALAVTGDGGIYDCRSAGTGSVWCGDGGGCETDDFYPGNGCGDPIFAASGWGQGLRILHVWM